MKKYVFYFN